MMIALITIYSGLIPWLRFYVLTSIITDLRLSVVYIHTFAFLFRKKKYVEEKKKLVQDLMTPLIIYTHMCNLCTYEYTYVEIYSIHLDSSDPPGVSSRPLGSHPSTPYVQCVCVCAYTHTYAHIHSHPR